MECERAVECARMQGGGCDSGGAIGETPTGIYVGM